MRKLAFFILVFLAMPVIGFIPRSLVAQNAVPMLVNYQGELRSPKTGEAVPDGSYDMVFRIYDVESGGKPLWTGNYATPNGNPVEVKNGIFQVVLGSGAGNALDAALFNGADRSLEISVGGETLSPRQRIISVPYAIVSENSRLLAGKEVSDFIIQAYGLRLESNATSPNVIGGHGDNAVTAGAVGATIAGGGLDGNANSVTDSYGTVGGGRSNQAGDNAGTTNDANYATVSGGYSNGAGNRYATVGGGYSNSASANSSTVSGGYNSSASANYATVGGGWHNSASGTSASVGGGVDNTASGSCATVGGGYDNQAIADYATISGGGRAVPGDAQTANRVTDDYGTVGGGGDNQAGDNAGTAQDRTYATVGGGRNNTASGSYATVGGGLLNAASAYGATVGGGTSNEASAGRATVGGGMDNTASGSRATLGGGEGNIASGDYAAVGGGCGNAGTGWYAAVGGGRDNAASKYYATVGGGFSNRATADYATIAGGGRADPGDAQTANRVTDDYGTVGGGGDNQAGDNAGTAQDRTYATVGGGRNNTASGSYATVGGGLLNAASGISASVGGGYQNTASGNDATVGGGYGNSASGFTATVPGGGANTASGWYSFAAGFLAKAEHNGAFVWGDESYNVFASTTSNQFSVRCTGGARFVSAIDGFSGAPTAGVRLSAGGGSWSSISDRALKNNLSPAQGKEVLAKLMSLPISSWNYKAQDPSIRHVGPTAQDFYAAFGLGEDDKHISTVDADGVALAAIQGLHEIVREKDEKVSSLEKKNAELERRLGALEELVEKLTDCQEEPK